MNEFESKKRLSQPGPKLKSVYLVTSKNTQLTQTIEEALYFFSSKFNLNYIEVQSDFSFAKISFMPWKIKLWAKQKAPNLLFRIFGAFDISPQSPSAAWNWINAINKVRPVKVHPNSHFENWLKTRNAGGKPVVLIGTGSSASDWGQKKLKDECILMVANSIVRSKHFLESLLPEIVVGADALFHFSETSHAISFRKAVETYLNKNANAFFLFPAHFSNIVFKTIMANPAQLVAIPTRKFLNGSVFDFKNSRKLPLGKNVLDYLLLPVSAAISNRIYLLGFDGKPVLQKEGIWESSAEFEFTAEKAELKIHYPGFFEFWDRVNISESNFGKNIVNQISQLDRSGYDISLLSPSNHKSLNALRVESEVSN